MAWLTEGEWSICPGRQSPKDGEISSKVDILNLKKIKTNFNLLCQIKVNSKNN